MNKLHQGEWNGAITNSSVSMTVVGVRAVMALISLVLLDHNVVKTRCSPSSPYSSPNVTRDASSLNVAPNSTTNLGRPDVKRIPQDLCVTPKLNPEIEGADTAASTSSLSVWLRSKGEGETKKNPSCGCLPTFILSLPRVKLSRNNFRVIEIVEVNGKS